MGYEHRNDSQQMDDRNDPKVRANSESLPPELQLHADLFAIDREREHLKRQIEALDRKERRILGLKD